MASITRFVDDLDGVSEAPGTTTITVRDDRGSFTIKVDLCDKNYATLSDKVLGNYKAKGKVSDLSTPAESDATLIRAWARENGFQVNDRGRIAADVVEAYNAANNVTAESA